MALEFTEEERNALVDIMPYIDISKSSADTLFSIKKDDTTNLALQFLYDRDIIIIHRNMFFGYSHNGKDELNMDFSFYFTKRGKDLAAFLDL